MDYKEYGFDAVKLAKRAQLMMDGASLYPYSYEISHKIDAAIQEVFQLERKQMPIDITVSFAGRVWSHRKMGGTFFIDLKDETSKIQLYCAKAVFSSQIWEQLL